MQLKRVKRELNRFAKYVIQQARTNLTRKKKNSTKKLYDSLQYKLNETPDATTLAFFMEEYGWYQDKGVSGKKRKFATPFSFKSKMPPASAFSQWVIRKGIKGIRNKQGKFVKRKSLQFMMARSVFYYGIKPSMFFTKPFERAYDKLKFDLPKKLAEDTDKNFEFLFNVED